MQSDKNAGFWWGDVAGNVGFQMDFSEKWQRFTTPMGALGPQFDTPAVSVGSGSPFHEIRIPAEPPVTDATPVSSSPGRIEKVFSRIRARQQQLGATKPILIRLAPNRIPTSRDQSPPPEPSSTRPGLPHAWTVPPPGAAK